MMIQYSVFSIQYSVFSIQYSVFSIHLFAILNNLYNVHILYSIYIWQGCLIESQRLMIQCEDIKILYKKCCITIRAFSYKVLTKYENTAGK